MKIASYLEGVDTVYGVVIEHGDDAGIITVDVEFRAQFPSIRSLLERAGLGELREWVAGRTPDRALDEVSYRPPLHDAEKVMCIGVNYAKRHPIHGVMPPPENITFFGKFEGTVVGHDKPLHYPPPPACDSFDYEGELVLVIGREGRHIAKPDVFDHIAGYTIMNDGSVRDWQQHSVPAGKNFFASSSCGPWMVTADEINDPSAMRLSTRLNGEEVQSTTAAAMIFDIPTIVAYVSTFIHLKPGDIISTGSPEGSGGSRQPQRFLKVGDELEIEWSGIGTLRNRVEAVT